MYLKKNLERNLKKDLKRNLNRNLKIHLKIVISHFGHWTGWSKPKGRAASKAAPNCMHTASACGPPAPQTLAARTRLVGAGFALSYLRTQDRDRLSIPPAQPMERPRLPTKVRGNPKSATCPKIVQTNFYIPILEFLKDNFPLLIVWFWWVVVIFWTCIC